MTTEKVVWRLLCALAAIGNGWAFYNHIQGIDGFEYTKGIALIVAMGVFAKMAKDGDL